MARYRVLAWREIPTQVKASDETGARADRVMPRWFMQEISRITMREGLAGTDDYLAEFAWSDEVERGAPRTRWPTPSWWSWPLAGGGPRKGGASRRVTTRRTTSPREAVAVIAREHSLARSVGTPGHRRGMRGGSLRERR